MEAAERIVAAVQAWRPSTPDVLVVGIDGPGGSGKTTIAAAVADATGAAVLHTDDFFRTRAEDSTLVPESGTNMEASAPLGRYYDWTALREQALLRLRAGQPAEFTLRHWKTFASTGTRARLEPRSVVLLEGVSASAPALADLVDRTVFVATPESVRLRRLRGRIADSEWDEAWLGAERRFFDARSRGAFDLIVPGASDPLPEPRCPVRQIR